MLILGIESSCDDTGVALVQDGKKIIHNTLISQTEIHSTFGGIVPEVAARQHIIALGNIIKEYKDLNLLDNIDGVAVTKGPGLAGSLLVGVNYAKALSYALDLPVRGINHLSGHIHAAWIDRIERIQFPAIALLVSGGHSELSLLNSHTDRILLGQTRDDAVGEVFDKVARAMGLGYPGGPIIDSLSKNSNQHIRNLPITNIADSLDYSFSGLKTAAIKYIDSQRDEDGKLSDEMISDISYDFQDCAVEQLLIKLKMAVNLYNPKNIIICGGVAANSHLRLKIKDIFKMEVIIPEPKLCIDNGAMISAAAFFEDAFSKETQLDLDIYPSLNLDEL
jgi:N6-L-threonylcarbamoyladenine synthase